MRYRVLIVDNEPWVLVYLKKTIPWEKLGFEIVGETANSPEALGMIQKLRPDVVFTDIRMPQLSGLELMQQAWERGVECEFVIISGFAEFSYAQEAIRLGVFEYCLKPISAEKGEELLIRLRDRLATKKTGKETPPEPDAAEEPEPNPEEAASNPKSSETFNSLIAYIQNHYTEKLRLKDVAQQFYLHPGYCSVLFSKHLGISFPEYLTSIRLKKACQLLLETNLSVNEISQRVGVEDYFYFNKLFKKNYGVTPGEYRKSQR